MADMHHVYLDLETGTWGDRSDLVIITLTDAELDRFAEQSDADRCEAWKGATRYFGQTWGGRIRRHLSKRDQPKQ